MYSLVIIAASQAVLEAFLIPVFVSKQPSDMDEQFHQSDQLKRPKQHKKLFIKSYKEIQIILPKHRDSTWQDLQTHDWTNIPLLIH